MDCFRYIVVIALHWVIISIIVIIIIIIIIIIEPLLCINGHYFSLRLRISYILRYSVQTREHLTTLHCTIYQF